MYSIILIVLAKIYQLRQKNEIELKIRKNTDLEKIFDIDFDKKNVFFKFLITIYFMYTRNIDIFGNRYMVRDEIF